MRAGLRVLDEERILRPDWFAESAQIGCVGGDNSYWVSPYAAWWLAPS
ncbi:hypothetical protein AAFP30_12970 [Gordonia sp. CPCC 205515]